MEIISIGGENHFWYLGAVEYRYFKLLVQSILGFGRPLVKVFALCYTLKLLKIIDWRPLLKGLII